MKLAFFKWSLAALLAGNATDSATSWGGSELNPALGRQFDARSAAIKFGLAGAVIGVEVFAVHERPALARPLGLVNFGLAGALGAETIRNVEVRSR